MEQSFIIKRCGQNNAESLPSAGDIRMCLLIKFTTDLCGHCARAVCESRVHHCNRVYTRTIGGFACRWVLRDLCRVEVDENKKV